jgi:hypothetical protein
MRVDVDVDLDGPVHGRGWSMDVDGRSTVCRRWFVVVGC